MKRSHTALTRTGVLCAALAVAQVTVSGSAVQAQAAPGASATPAANVKPLTAYQLQLLLDRLDALERANAAQTAEIGQLQATLRAITARGLAAAPAAGPPPIRQASLTTSSTTTAAVTPDMPPLAPAPSASATPAPLRSAPPANSVQGIYQQQNAVIRRRLTLTPSFSYGYSDNNYFTLNGFLALGAIFLGNINVTSAANTIDIAQMNASYGLNDRLQIDATVPYYLRSSTFNSVGAMESGQSPSQDVTNSAGLGDVQFGAYDVVHRESTNSPGITLNAHISIPTGRAPFGIKLATDPVNDTLQYPSQLPTGSGVVGYEVGASFVKTADPAIFFGGANVYIQTTGHFRDLSNAAGTLAPGNATPGSALQLQAGTAFALNERSSLSFSFIDTITGNTRIMPAGGSAQSIIGSSTNAAVFDISNGYATGPRRTFITDLQIGLTKDAPNFQLGFRFPLQF